jgi:hypothetical protein
MGNIWKWFLRVRFGDCFFGKILEKRKKMSEKYELLGQ